MIGSGSRVLIASAAAGLMALAVAAPGASASELQNESGDPYTGTLSGTLSDSAVFTTSGLSITCNESTFSGTVTGAGSPGNPATADVSTIDWTNSGSEACQSVLPHQNFIALDLPWDVETGWLSDNTAGAPNGVATISGISVDVVLSVGTCTYVGNFNDSAGNGNQIQVDVYNPDNPGPDTRLVFNSEPFQAAEPGCPESTQASATYTVTGDGGEKLRVTGTELDLPPASDPYAVTQPATSTATPAPTVNPACAPLRKKLKNAKTKKAKRALRKKLRKLGC